MFSWAVKEQKEYKTVLKEDQRMTPAARLTEQGLLRVVELRTAHERSPVTGGSMGTQRREKRNTARGRREGGEERAARNSCRERRARRLREERRKKEEKTDGEGVGEGA